MTIANVTATTAITAAWGNSVADAINDDIVPGLAALPQGVVAYAMATSTNQTGIDSTPTSITGTSVSFTAVAGRRYRATLNVTTSQSSTAGIQTVYLTNDDGFYRGRSQSAIASQGALSWCLVEQFTATAGTLVVVGGASVDAGTMTVNNDFSREASLIVEDIGPS